MVEEILAMRMNGDGSGGGGGADNDIVALLDTFNSHHRELVFNDSFTFPQRDFTAPAAVQDFSSSSRFGHTNDFFKLLGSQEEQQDYIFGLVWMGGIVAGFFVLWLFLIVLFWILGKRRVGFLSGQPFERSYYYSADRVNNTDNDEKSSSIPLTPTHNQTYGSDDGGDVYIEDDSPQKRTPSSRGKKKSFTNMNDSNDGDDNELEESAKNDNNNSNRHQTITDNHRFVCCGYDYSVWIRLVFVLCGISCIVFAIFMVVFGLTNLQNTVDEMNRSSGDVATLSDNAREILRTGILAVQKSGKNISTALQNELQMNNFCPDNPQLNGLAQADEIQQLASDGLAQLKSLEDYTQSSDLEAILEGLDASSTTAHDVQDATADIDISDWESLIVLIFGTVVPTMLLASVIMSSYGATNPIFQCIVWWFFFPLFVLMAIIAAVISATMLISSTVNSDFCYPSSYDAYVATIQPPTTTVSSAVSNVTTTTPLLSSLLDSSTILRTSNNTVRDVSINSPDVTVLQVLQQQGLDRTSIEYRIASFYITQCSTVNPLDDIVEYGPELNETRATVIDFEKSLNDTNILPELTKICGRDYDDILDSIKQIKALLTALYNALTDMIALIRCDSIVPIYQNTFYDATCTYSVKAFVWTFASSLVIAVCSFIMIMCRSAMCETIYTYQYDTGSGSLRNSSTKPKSAFHDENEDDGDGYNNSNNNYNSPDNATRGGDTVMRSIEDYEYKNGMTKASPY